MSRFAVVVMPCLCPICVPVRSGNKKGHSYLVPCGKCDECQERRKNAFVFRVQQEQLHGTYKYCHFITLTYQDKFLPYESFSCKKAGSPVDPVSTGESVLNPYDLTQFFKRYRLLLDEGDSVKYLAAGEYGKEENTHRPHYHIILFCNQDWKTCVRISQLAWSYLVAETAEDRKMRYAKARKLKKIIKRDSHSMKNRELIGRVNVLCVSFGRINYVAKYCNKQLFKDEVVPPFVRLSNGLGKSFLDSKDAKVCKEQNRHYTYFENGLPVAIPRYFTHRLFSIEQMDDFQLDVIKRSTPPDKVMKDIYKCLPGEYGDNDFMSLGYELDVELSRQFMKAYANGLRVATKRKRLARYGFYYG